MALDLLSNAAYIHPRAISSVFEATKALIMALKNSIVNVVAIYTTYSGY